MVSRGERILSGRVQRSWTTDWIVGKPLCSLSPLQLPDLLVQESQRLLERGAPDGGLRRLDVVQNAPARQLEAAFLPHPLALLAREKAVTA